MAAVGNLRSRGRPGKDGGGCHGLGMGVPGGEQKGAGMPCRRQLVGRGDRLLMQLGDQLGDFVQASANAPAKHDALHAEYQTWFGERWWVLPNPSYGSWEPALFNNAWNLPEAERRRLKLEAMDFAE